MATYAFIAFVFIGGSYNPFVLDTGLTLEDCGAAVAGGVADVELADGSTMKLPADVTLACEVETQNVFTEN